ncbi:hypothetical protein [Pontibacter sp. G13]|uniref:hypothetical protein n=1 Tax=Pontibacter sp. G13 TaxID=3074898 RepID=UPI00288A0447|nr:hypothetical protein [Pontibacter sp. G13]WNJ18167.1 hypothetical protein RJD25_25230 [Pontibacter sp. G13]
MCIFPEIIQNYELMHVISKVACLLVMALSMLACQPSSNGDARSQSPIVGTWQLVYGEIREGDSVQIKDLSETTFLKIINPTHFAFFNQHEGSSTGFYGGGGTWKLEGDRYVERLNLIEPVSIRGHEFPFTVEFRGDTLVQYGHEEVPEAGIDRDIVEKYLRVQ